MIGRDQRRQRRSMAVAQFARHWNFWGVIVRRRFLAHSPSGASRRACCGPSAPLIFVTVLSIYAHLEFTSLRRRPEKACL